MAAVDLSKLLKEKRFWAASFLIAWAAGLQGHMMWLKRQDAFKDKFGDPEGEAPNKVTEQPADDSTSLAGELTADAEIR
ncbi:hypothetical protein CFC21_045118 [Triticum aestivum]|uniref:Uncharacterized protein n=3 Tax=Triticum TaxID=4564 RepID=A0A077RWA1_WHEAT|nr:uncharacterized protein LOC119279015 [Triticum dicoccoides]KAF7034065.1 hypothetical protein CFC21_045118 [Triticum aestivum]CDM81474.1 unnamed protein product [Triticum aestivum]CDM87227.1 unnamed protein product [Triticum aestivum]VAH86582.1 unnamed protein product [Triticum turgidum subsp. durum]